MSIRLKIDQLDLPTRQKITKELNFKVGGDDKKRFSGVTNRFKSQYITPYLINKETSEVYLPFSYALGAKPPGAEGSALEGISGTKRPERKDYKPIDIKFQQPLRESQKQVRDEIITTINKTGSCVLSFYPGFGKTSLSIYLASKIGLKTVVIVHRLILIQQWIESIEKFCPGATHSVIKSKYKPGDLVADFLLVNATNVEKIGMAAFVDVGLLVVDEIHTIATESLSKSLFYITPRYLIGLSATPHRADGMDVLLDVYFGKIKISRKLYRPHIIYRIDTGFVPEVKYNSSGTVDWCSVIEFQSNNQERNNMIVELCRKNPDRFILILCKRISQAEYLLSKLQVLGEPTTSLLGGRTEYDKNARIMVATVQKCGVGFDFSKLDTLILATDVKEYFVQYLGRIMRHPEGVEPLVFDIVDDNPILKRHFNVRKKVYLEAGGIIKKSKP